MQSFIIGKNEAGQRLDKFLNKYLPNAPKSLIYKSLRKKNITLNRKKAYGSEILSISDSIETFFSDETFNKFKNNSDTIIPNSNFNLNKKNNMISNDDIIYEDENIILLNKKQGVLSQKSNFNDYSVNEWLIDYMLETNQITNEDLHTFKPSICNRLDRNTGGILICGKSLLGIQTMTELIRDKKIAKHYLTICHGDFKHEGRVTAYIEKDIKTNKSIVVNDSFDKPNIITEFKILKKLRNATLLDVNILTGKSHQIRASLASFNNPIFGDKKYGSSKYNDNIEKNLKYQLLFAYKLVFPAKELLPKEFSHLGDKEFSISVPEVINNILTKLEIN